MIVWIILVGSLFILLTAPACAFGWACGKIALAWLHRDRKPPLRPPI